MPRAALVSLPFCSRLIAIAGAFCVLACASQSHAQASVTASRSLGLAAFAGATGVHPEFNRSPVNYGFLIGGDATRSFRLASPSLELRFNDASGATVSQKSFLAGIKVEHEFADRFHPYLDVLVGTGSTNFTDPGDPAYTHDTSLVLDGGAGLDFDLTKNFAIKADFQVQRWRLGQEQPAFSPELVSVGLVYRPTFGRLSIR